MPPKVNPDYSGPPLRFIDIGVNLTDPVFRGVHHGRKKHEDDMAAMLERSQQAGVKSMIITGGSLSESCRALKLAKELDLYATIGCHPTRSAEFNKAAGGPEKYLADLDKLIGENLEGKGRVVAVGECGLDYDRLHFAPEETQRVHFRSQLALAKKYHLPMFLHSRAAHKDFVQILRDEGFGVDGGSAVGGRGGVIHSFTGKPEEAKELVEMGFYIGINGCGLKTDENLAMVATIPLDRIMLETDAPWCSMTTSHSSHKHLESLPDNLRAVFLPPGMKSEKFVMGKPVKSRNEPGVIGGVAWVLHRIFDVPVQELTEMAWKNTVQVFSLDELESKS